MILAPDTSPLLNAAIGESSRGSAIALPPINDPLSPAQTPQTSQTLAFVDRAIADIDTLIQGLENSTVVLIDTGTNGLDQITQTLKQYENLDSIQIYAHGGEASLTLGNSVLNAANLGEHTDALTEWGEALSEPGDLLLYGCNVSAGPSGIDFVSGLSAATGADVAASSNFTGANLTGQGSDWLLETSIGNIEAENALNGGAQEDFEGSLALEAELINNGSFESGLDEWAIFSGQEAVSSTETISGKQSLKLSGADSGTGQIMAGRAGERVQLSGYAKSSSPTFGGFGLHFLDADYNVISSIGGDRIDSNSWKQYTAEGTAPTGTAFMQVWTYQTLNDGSTFIDGLSLTQTGLESTPILPVEPTPVAPDPVEPTPIEPTPVAPTLIEPTPVAPTLIEPTPVAPTLIEPTPVAPTPVAPTLIEPTPVAPTPVAPTPVAPTPTAPPSNTPPTNTGGEPTAEIFVTEGAPFVTEIKAAGSGLSYAIVGGADASDFRLDPSTGNLSFKAAPDYEKPIDADVNNVYDVKVAVNNGAQVVETRSLTVKVNNKVSVFLMGGQSNMSGIGLNRELTGDLAKPYDPIKMWDTQTFTSLRPGFSGAQGNYGEFGPELTFGRGINGATQEEVYLIKHAEGATTLANDWDPNGANNREHDIFVDRVGQALGSLAAQNVSYDVEGMLWMQGESDNIGNPPAVYANNLKEFIGDMRSRYNPNLKFVIGKIHPAFGEEVRTAQESVAAEDPLTYIVNTDNMQLRADGVHYNTAGQLDLGYAFANAIKAS